jgi:hypothetical protein
MCQPSAGLSSQMKKLQQEVKDNGRETATEERRQARIAS